MCAGLFYVHIASLNKPNMAQKIYAVNIAQNAFQKLFQYSSSKCIFLSKRLPIKIMVDKRNAAILSSVN